MSALLGLRNPAHVFGDDGERIEALATALAAAIDTKGRYSPSHSWGVSKIATTIAARMGVNGYELARLRLAALLHDLGKLQTPDAILLAPRALEPHEWDVIEEHPRIGHDMLLSLGLRDEARWVLHHHERFDGSGYPTGLAGISIPLASRIIGVADAYDVMTSKRSYKDPKPPGWALTELRRHAGTQFCPDVVEVALDVLADAHATRSR